MTNEIELTWEQLKKMALHAYHHSLDAEMEELCELYSKIIDWADSNSGIIQIIEEGECEKKSNEICFKALDYIEHEHDYRRCQKEEGHQGGCE